MDATHIILTLVFLLLIVVNLTAFGVMWFDKRRAQKGGQRISERTIFILALAFGCIGVFAGMRVFHHKTRKKTFTIGIPIIFCLQILFLIWLANMFNITL